MRLDNHLLLLVAFLATLVVYAILSLDGASVDKLDDLLLIEVGALAGVALPKRSASS